MDSSQFDDLVRGLAGRWTRRGIAGVGIGAVAHVALAALGVGSLSDVAAKGKKGKGGGKGNKGKGKGKGKGKKACRATMQGVGFEQEGCAAPGDKCASDEDRQHGQEHAAQCTTSSNNVCDLLALADDCRAALVPCCNFHALCDQGAYATCRDDAYRANPELCDFVFIPICTGP